MGGFGGIARLVLSGAVRAGRALAPQRTRFGGLLYELGFGRDTDQEAAVHDAEAQRSVAESLEVRAANPLTERTFGLTREELARIIRRNVRDALKRSAIIMQREIKLQLSMSSSPSAPGTPPGVVTGTLRRSVQIDLTGLKNVNRPSVRVGPDLRAAPYARIHELGGVIRAKPGSALRTPFGPRQSVTMPKRPYIVPAVKAARARILAQFSTDRLVRP